MRTRGRLYYREAAEVTSKTRWQRCGDAVSIQPISAPQGALGKDMPIIDMELTEEAARTEQVERTNLFYNPLENPRITHALSEIAIYLAGVLEESNRAELAAHIDKNLNPDYNNRRCNDTQNSAPGSE